MTSLELFETDWRDLWSGEPQEAVGAIYTRPEIVDLILDLAGYVCGSSRLACKPLLEPSCGDGAFLSAVIARLVRSEIEQLGSVDWGDETLDTAICAADISEASVKTARALIRAELRAAGCPAARARALATKWTFHTDFLLQDASYFRLRTVTLTRALPTSWVKGRGFTTARAFVTGANLVTITKYRGFNPDVSSQGVGNLNRGIDSGAYPLARTWTFGLNLSY